MLQGEYLMRWTIRRKLTAGIALPLLIAYTLILLWDFGRQRDDAQRLMQQLAMDRASQLAGVYSARLQWAAQSAHSLAAAIAARAPARTLVGPGEFAAPLRQNEWIVAVTLAWRPEGESELRGLQVRRSALGPPRPEPLSDTTAFEHSDWYQQAMAGQPGWIIPRLAATLETGLLSYTTPILINGEARGAIAVHVPRTVLSQSGRPHRGMEPGPLPTTAVTVDAGAAAAISSLQPTDSVVLGAGGEIIYRWATSLAPTQPASEAARAQARKAFADGMSRARQGSGGVERIANVGPALGARDGGAYWIAFSPIAGTDWTFASAISEERVMQPLMREMAGRGGVLLLVTLALGAMVYMVAVRMSRPIEEMAAAARRLGNGDLSARVPNRRGHDEVAELGRVFNHMVQRIRTQMDHLRNETAAREAVESELRVARSIQADLLPREFPPFPDRHEFALWGSNVPARRVAGDFFDYFFTPRGTLLVAIADVSGKGVPAALLMAVTRTLIRTLAMNNLRPLEIVRSANTTLVQDTSAWMFVSLFICEYDTATGEFDYVNAGHPSPYSLRRDGSCSDLGDSTAPLVGVMHDWPEGSFCGASARLEPGESLVLYTDGVTEARTEAGEFFGDQSLREAILTHAANGPEYLCRAIVSRVEKHQAAPQDDITVVVLQRRG